MNVWKLILFCFLTSSFLLRASVADAEPIIVKLRDQDRKLIFCLEADKIHISAHDFFGKIIWRKSLVKNCADNNQIFIVYMGFITKNDWNKNPIYTNLGDCKNYIAIRLSNLSFGLLNKDNGNFIWLGRD